ncbi:hypothetical protein FMUND_14337 [Fusarium mundagurra]|uniref:Uncharacterized protein n=1 Tax=Fusarium mundagurra TaxID=1567541 RepID=A0A8H6D217_9HYPO|nr:hypothetical protein FMUND_14337 [Fusarium mundagurra]
MAPHNQGFANGDLQKLKSHLLELKLAYSMVPTQRSQGKVGKNPKTTSASSSDTKEAIIEKVESDLNAIANSVFIQGEHSSFRLPPSKASTDLYNKLKEIRDSDRDCTEEDIDQVDSLLKRFVRELDPNHPFVAEPHEDSLKGKTLYTIAADRTNLSQGGATDVQDVNQPINEDADGDLAMEDHGVRDPDSQDETMGGFEAPTEDGE